jgi:hypothetical protein
VLRRPSYHVDLQQLLAAILGDEIEAGELGQDPAVDPVGLAGQRRETAGLDRIR